MIDRTIINFEEIMFMLFYSNLDLLLCDFFVCLTLQTLFLAAYFFVRLILRFFSLSINAMDSIERNRGKMAINGNSGKGNNTLKAWESVQNNCAISTVKCAITD